MIQLKCESLKKEMMNILLPKLGRINIRFSIRVFDKISVFAHYIFIPEWNNKKRYSPKLSDVTSLISDNSFVSLHYPISNLKLRYPINETSDI